MDLTLTLKERLILLNQYRILELIDVENADQYKKLQIILADAYELEYSELHQFVARTPFTAAQCRNVLDVLTMFEVLGDSYDALDDKSGIEEWRVRFQGYDGNNEAEYVGYVRYLVDHGDRFTHVVNGTFNSHRPVVRQYAEMLARFGKHMGSTRLPKQRILEIVGQ